MIRGKSGSNKTKVVERVEIKSKSYLVRWKGRWRGMAKNPVSLYFTL